jgi:hypothetical protein
MRCEYCGSERGREVCANEGDEYILCPKCQKTLENLDQEYDDIINN